MRAIFSRAIALVWRNYRGSPWYRVFQHRTTLHTYETNVVRDLFLGIIRKNWRESEQTTVQVIVRDNNVDQALKALKKKMQREGIFREMKLRRSYEKPSERRAREKAEAVRRARKLERKRVDREGF
jgi:small subunit ribosomal protein S21